MPGTCGPDFDRRWPFRETGALGELRPAVERQLGGAPSRGTPSDGAPSPIGRLPAITETWRSPSPLSCSGGASRARGVDAGLRALVRRAGRLAAVSGLPCPAGGRQTVGLERCTSEQASSDARRGAARTLLAEPGSAGTARARWALVSTSPGLPSSATRFAGLAVAAATSAARSRNPGATVSWTLARASRNP